MIAELTISFVGGKFHLTACTERGMGPETAGHFLVALTELIGKPEMVAEAFGCTLDELDAVLNGKTGRPVAPPIVTVRGPEGLQ